MVEPRQTGRAGEQGFMLMAVIVMVALVLVALAVAAPVVAKDIRRDKEVESEHRAEQYVRAIRLFQRKFPGQYPPSIEALEKTNNIRFLRQQYVDPLTGKADWRIIHVGQNQTTVKGFFGEPLAGLASTGIGGGAGGGTATVGPVNGLAAGFGGAQVGVPGASGATGASGASGASGGIGGTSLSSLGSGGAGPIMGVGSSRTGDSILVPNEQTTYETWEFLYDPRIEQMYAKGALNGGIGTGAGGIGIGGLNGLNGASGSAGASGASGNTGPVKQ